MGFSTIDMVLFVPADPPELKVTVRTWLRKHYEGALAPKELIKNTDPDDFAARYYAVEMRVTPEMFSVIRKKLAKPAFSAIKLRSSLRGTYKEFRRELKQELASKGWRVKPAG